MKTINITKHDVDLLIDILNKLNIKNFNFYWILFNSPEREILINKNKENLNQILEYYKRQISKLFILNIVEKNLTEKNDGQLNKVINNIKQNIENQKILNANELCLQNIDTIFCKHNLEFIVKPNYDLDNFLQEKKYLIEAVTYANSFNENKTKKKILNNI